MSDIHQEIKVKILEILATGMTQEELAKDVPCGQSTISSYLTGSRGKRISVDIWNGINAVHKRRCGAEKQEAA